MAETLSFSLTRYAQEIRGRVDAALKAYTDLGEGCPPVLREAMQYALLAPGKRLRPMLVLMAAEACAGTAQEAMPAACAVEMVHAYSLVHDDLPAMDNDDLRRGRPTCHKRFGEAVAILAGDALLALAFEILARDVRRPARAAACCAVLAEAAGACHLVGGQTDDISGPSAQDGLARLECIHRRKTGAMILASLRLGAIVAGAQDADMAMLEQYGSRIGLAFQITDDLLDVRGNETAMGKRVGKDSDQGKLTFPGLLGVDKSARRAEQLIAEARQAIQPLGPRAEGLDAVARYVLERNC